LFKDFFREKTGFSIHKGESESQARESKDGVLDKNEN